MDSQRSNDSQEIMEQTIKEEGNREFTGRRLEFDAVEDNMVDSDGSYEFDDLPHRPRYDFFAELRGKIFANIRAEERTMRELKLYITSKCRKSDSSLLAVGKDGGIRVLITSKLEKFGHVFKNFRTYLVKGFELQDITTPNPDFNVDYVIILVEESEVIPYVDDSDNQGFKPILLSKLQNYSPGSLIDVIGVLVNIDDIKEAGQNILHLYIVDRTKTTVCVEVRGEDVNEKLVFHAAMFSPIGFGHVKVSKSQDGFQILTVLPATAIEYSNEIVDPDGSLKQWFDEARKLVESSK